jgi:hypothetical protein
MKRLVFLLTLCTAVFAQAPANDDPAGATPVFDGINPGAPAGGNGLYFSGVNATMSAGFTMCAGTGDRDVFFLYTATNTGPCMFNTCTPAQFTTGSVTDSTLDVYDSTGPGGLPGVKLACDDDGCLNSGLNSTVTATVTAGANYYVRVANWSTGAVLGTFYVTIAPTDATTANAAQGEDCATTTAILPSVTNGVAQGRTTGALSSAPSGTCASFLVADVDVWWQWVAPASGTLFLSRESSDPGNNTGDVSGATKLGVYDGAGGCPALVNILCTTTASNVSVPVVGGGVYYIRGGSVAGTQQGSFALTWFLVLPPANDDCTSAEVVVDGVNPAAGTYSNLGGLDDAGYSAAACAAGAVGSKGVWFSYVASITGNITVQTCTPTGLTAGSLTDTVLEVFDNCGVTFTSIACNDNSCSNLSSTAFSALAGNAYWFRVSSKSTTLSGSFYVSVILPPVNDDCSAATTVVDGVNPAAGTYSNVGGTDDAGYSAAACAAGAVGSKGVWFVYVATTTGTTWAATCNPAGPAAGSLTDTVLEVFDNCGVNFTSIACNDNSCVNLSRTSFASTAGNVYWIRVSSKSTTLSGSFYVLINPAPPNDECASPLTMTTGANGPYFMLGATNSAAAAPTCQATISSDMWFAFTAPDTGTVKMSTCGGSIPDPVLVVYDVCGGTQLACDDDDLNNLGPCSTSSALQAYIEMPVVAGTTYVIRIGNFSATTIGNYQLSITYKFSFSITKPTANDVELKDFAGTPGNVAFNAITLSQGAFPNGWFYGVDIPFGEILNEANSGPPFLVVLDGTGAYSVTFSGIPFLGLTFYTVAIEFSLAGLFVQKSDAVAYTI